VTSEGVRLCDGTTAGVGDVVVTRLNQRALTTGRGWVKNGDDWTVRAIRDDGPLRATRPGGGSTVLPPGYVAEHVELGYAATAHRAQGRTVDTPHAYLSAGTTREPLYVMATRGRQANRLYVDTATEPDQATAHAPAEHLEAIDALQNVIAASTAELSATETRRREQQLHHARSLSRPLSRIESRHAGPSRDLL
jgi:ATP-dependent exoDNAse (exonuclease V) alpha subunit